MDESWVLIDENTGLHVAWYFWLRVLDEVNRSARYGHPFALLLLEADVQPGTATRVLEDAAARVPPAIRSTDMGGHVAAGRVGVLLPHQDIAAAEAAKRRIVEQLERTAPRGVRWEARLLCYPADGAELSNVLTSGWRERRTGGGISDIAQLA